MCIVTSSDAISYAHSNRLKAEYFAKRTYPNLYLRTRYDQNNLRKNLYESVEKLQLQKHNSMIENSRKIRYNNIADFPPSFHFYI